MALLTMYMAGGPLSMCMALLTMNMAGGPPIMYMALLTINMAGGPPSISSASDRRLLSWGRIRVRWGLQVCWRGCGHAWAFCEPYWAYAWA